MKAINRKKISSIKRNQLFTRKTLIIILPVVGYFVFGISNVILLSLSMKTFPPSIAYALWSGLVIGFASLVDRIYFKHHFSWIQYFFLLCIAMGVAGLNFTTK
jgi:quaternary ammonium compound-resistance protein SugE